MESTALGQTKQPPTTSTTLPEDIIFFHILPLLPLHNVIQLRCVSKTWHTFLTKPLFLNLQRHLNRQIMIIIKSTATYSDIPIDYQSLDFDETSINFPTTIQTHPPPYPKASTFAGSCNGVLLLHNPRINRFYLWNLATTQCIKLPILRVSKSEYFLEYSGIGIHPITKDYKIVVKFCDYRQKIYICNGRTKTWQTVGRKIPEFLDTRGNVGVCVGRFLYWSCRRDNRMEYVILCFDLVEDKFKTLESPTKRGVPIQVCALDGLLCVLYVNGPFEIEFLVMKNAGVNEHWMKLMSVPTWGSSFMEKPLCLTHNGGVVLQSGQYILCYDPKAKQFKTLFRADPWVSIQTVVFGKTTRDLNYGCFWEDDSRFKLGKFF